MLKTHLKLISGHNLKNRLGKSAMAESMSVDTLPKQAFVNAYSTWAQGGLGLCITGNVMVDRNHLGEFKNVVLDESVEDLSDFKLWATAAKKNSTVVFMQLNHPGKQTPKFLTPEPVAPSAIAFDPPLGNMFNKPRALNEDEVWKVIQAFGVAAKKAQEAGFDGVQIHGAHGYLVSQFLSPLHNQREDQWGGSLENRMRFVLEIVKCIKQNVGKNFGLAIKLNSADFQKGGFTEEESMEVVRALDVLELDFIEISGGTYEVNAMMGKKSKQNKNVKLSTQKREAYFIEYAQKVKSFLRTPLMVTGGFRDKETMELALERGDVDIIGMGRPFAVYPDLANKILNDEKFQMDISAKKTGNKLIDSIVPLEITWYAQQIHRLGKNLAPRPHYNVWLAISKSLFDFGFQGLRRTRHK